MVQKVTAIGLKMSVLNMKARIISLWHSLMRLLFGPNKRNSIINYNAILQTLALLKIKRRLMLLGKSGNSIANHRVYGPLVVDGMEFDNYEDFELNNGEYVMIGLPDVYQLEEWFELNRPGQVGK